MAKMVTQFTHLNISVGGDADEHLLNNTIFFKKTLFLIHFMYLTSIQGIKMQHLSIYIISWFTIWEYPAFNAIHFNT